jgi:hypothetical protein
MRVSVSKLFGFVLAALSLFPSAAIAQVQINQEFIPQGPSPAFGPLDTTGSGDANDGADGTNSGAVQAILLDPMLGAGTMFIGATNGGIWMTTDAGATWSHLTDNFASLSIASLALNPTDPTGNTLIAGIGVTTSGTWGPVLDPGARSTGLLLSTDGGQGWTPLAGASAFAHQSVIGVAAFGSGDTMTILAATFEEKDPTCTKTGRCPAIPPIASPRAGCGCSPAPPGSNSRPTTFSSLVWAPVRWRHRSISAPRRTLRCSRSSMQRFP